LAAIAAVLVVVAVGSVFWGRYPSAGFTWPGRLADDDLARQLVLTLRVPRVLTALALGMSLAAAGTVFQQIFANPLIEPGFLGVSQGAAFGAALSLVAFARGPVIVEIAALAFALLGLGLSWTLARLIRYGGWILRLVLAGIAVSAVFSAGIGLLKMAADPANRLPEITFWLLGGLGAVTWRDVLFIAPPVILGVSVVSAFRWRLNVLSLDDRVAHALGTAPGRERALLLVAATMATAAAISVSGLVGWAGLLVPHAARRLYGTDASRSLPASLPLGAIYILACDDVARTALPAEIPLGVLTAILGACAFVALMIARRREHGG